MYGMLWATSFTIFSSYIFYSLGTFFFIRDISSSNGFPQKYNTSYVLLKTLNFLTCSLSGSIHNSNNGHLLRLTPIRSGKLHIFSSPLMSFKLLSFPFKFRLSFFFLINLGLSHMIGLVIATLHLPDNILQCFSFIKFYFVLEFLWQYIEVPLDVFLLIFEVGYIPQKLQNPYCIY